jgi:hypothetical protein
MGWEVRCRFESLGYLKYNTAFDGSQYPIKEIVLAIVSAATKGLLLLALVVRVVSRCMVGDIDD